MVQGNAAYSAFGLSLAFEDLSPPGEWKVVTHKADLTVTTASRDLVERSFACRPGLGWTGWIDGGRFSADVGQDGDLMFTHPSGVHRLRAEGMVLQCAPTDAESSDWWRIVLDAVLVTVALWQGREALHAGSVLMDGRAVAIAAASGGGKSTLVHELVGRGHLLLADDVTVIDRQLMAYPGAPVMTLPELILQTSERSPIVRLPDETWVEAPVADKPAPLAALVVLDRRAGELTLCAPMATTLAPLLDAMLTFPLSPERELGRFDLASRICDGSALYELVADVTVPPAELADLVESVAARP